MSGAPTSAPPSPPEVSPAGRAALLDLATASVQAGLEGRPLELARDQLPAELLAPAATFVTLERGGRLLGCIGTMEAHRPLVDDVVANARASAFADPRLPPVGWDDLAEMDVHISVLSPLVHLEVSSLTELAATVQPGIDGLLITAGAARGTFLPSVWEQLPDTGQFLDHLWHKAGMRPGSWPDGIVVYRYRTLSIGG